MTNVETAAATIMAVGTPLGAVDGALAVACARRVCVALAGVAVFVTGFASMLSLSSPCPSLVTSVYALWLHVDIRGFPTAAC